MGLNLTLSPLSVPAGSEFPGTLQALIVLLTQYIEIAGGETFSGINFGDTTPAAADRDKPWFETDASGNPLGWKSWDGSAWSALRVRVGKGTTAQRPDDAEEGELYLDTDIDVMLVYERSAWRTLSGSPGDVKEVKAATLQAALDKNPGWVEDTDSAGRLIASVSDGTNHEYGDTFGAETHTITVGELPAHSHEFLSGYGVFPGQFQNGPQAAGIAPLTTGLGDAATISTAAEGSGTAMNIMPPVIYYWRLVKS